MTGFPLETSFRPRRWLRGRHFQTILPSLPPRRAWVERRAVPLLAASEELLLDCGDGVTLQAFHSSPAKRGRDPGRKLAVLLHGWEGSADSTYQLSLASSLFTAGFEVVRLNLRDHGATHHLNRDLFHSCRLPEVVGAVQALAMKFTGLPMALAGFSLGGNFMLRVAAHAEAPHLPLERVIAISPVLDPAETLTTLERGTPLYHGYFVRKWSRSLAKKQQAWPGHYDFEELLRMRNLARDDTPARAQPHRVPDDGGLSRRLLDHGWSSDDPRGARHCAHLAGRSHHRRRGPGAPGARSASRHRDHCSRWALRLHRNAR